jgi:WD40 repeat protein
MNTVARAQTTPVRTHAGWLWAALVLHALGIAVLQFGSYYISLFESRLDWGLRVCALAALALGLIQLSALLVRRVAGAEIAASMRRRMILATMVLGGAGILSIASDRTNMILFGLLIGLAWRKWMRGPLLWLLAAAAAGLIAYPLYQSSLELLSELRQAVGFPANRVILSAYLGLVWSLLAGIAFALLVTFAPAESWESWRQSISKQAELTPIPRFVPRILVALALAGGLWITYAQGSQNCHWIDRATGRSGCVGTLAMPSAFDTNLSFSQDGAWLLATNGDDITLYDFPGRRMVQDWMLQEDALIYTSAISADGGQIALALNDSAWDDTRVRIYRRGETTPFQTLVVSETFFPQLGFALDGRSLLIENAGWNIATGAPLGRVDSDTRASYRTGSGAFNDYSADGSLSVRSSGTKQGMYRSRYDGSIGALVAPLPGVSSNDALTIAFSADNALLAIASRSNTSQVAIMRTSDGSPVATLDLTPFGSADIEALAFTPDNRYLLVARSFREQIEIYQLP